MGTKVKAKTQSKKSQNSLVVGGAIVLGIVILVGAFLFLRQDPGATSIPLEISVAEAATKRDAGAFILDVRQPEEWVEYHIPESTLIPLGELASRVNELPKDQEIVVVCRSGNRSQQGRDILQNAGFDQVTSMAGGLKQWQAEGYPTVSGP